MSEPFLSHSLLESNNKKALIIAAKANVLIVSRLIDGAMRALDAGFIKPQNIQVIKVPGALEIPLTLKKAAFTRQFNVYVVLGAVIKGKTDHYEHVARMANDGVMSVSLECGLALGNGILTVHNLKHALERADGPCGNLGFDAAKAALSLFATFLELEQLKRDQ